MGADINGEERGEEEMELHLIHVSVVPYGSSPASNVLKSRAVALEEVRHGINVAEIAVVD